MESVYAERALKFGEFRLRAAADYLALEGDCARRDDELSLSWQTPPDAYKASVVATGQPLKVVGPVTWSEQLSTNYYVICFSTRWGEDLFDEFKGADACLVIRDTDAFCELIHHAVDRLLPKWIGHDQKVTYGGSGKLGVSYAKQDRFLPQAEYRFSWLPPSAKGTLQPVTFQVGNIESIAHVEPRSKRTDA